MSWDAGTGDEIADAFSMLEGVLDRNWQSLGLTLLACDTGQPEMVEAKRRYIASDKGRAARERAAATHAERMQDASYAAAFRARKAATEARRRARGKAA